MAYPKHSRFVYANYEAIENAINTGELNEFDICISQDTKELLLVKDDLDILPIKSKIYRFVDIMSAETVLNNSSDTYEGQLVAILQNGKYVAYIVNYRNDHFVVDSLATVQMTIDYDELTHAPVINKYGQIGAPIMLEGLADGIYKVNGQFRISESLPTVFSSAAGNIFVIEHLGDEVDIKKIGATDITNYHINAKGNVTVARYITTDYLTQNGYATQAYVDLKIAALDFITRDEMSTYVSELVKQNIDQIIDARIDAAIEAHTNWATEQDIRDIFVT